MTQLSEKVIVELRAIVEEECEVRLTTAEAEEVGTRVVGLIRLLPRSLPGESGRAVFFMGEGFPQRQAPQTETAAREIGFKIDDPYG